MSATDSEEVMLSEGDEELEDGDLMSASAEEVRGCCC
jgi:hypothetical protein